MPTFNKPILTNAGKDLLNRVNSGQTKASYTKTVFSSMNNSNLTDDAIRNLTSIQPTEITANPSTNLKENNTVEIRTIGSNKGLQQSTSINTYATYAKDDSGNEIVFAIAVTQSPDFMPADSGKAITNVTFSILFTTQNTENISFSDPHNELPTYQDITDLKTSINNIQGAIDSSLKPYDDRITQNKNSIDNINSELPNKADKTETDNSIRTAMNQANSHSDSNYSDLSNKNNILSNQISDYQKPNLAPFTEESIWNNGKTINISVKQGKTYCFSMYIERTDSWWGYFEINQNGSWNTLGNPANVAGDTVKAKYTAQSDGMLQVHTHSSVGASAGFSNICITETSDFIPFSVAQQNKASIESASQTDLDNAKSDLQNKTNDLSNKVDENFKKDNARMDYLGATKYDKTETYNKGEVDNKTDNLSSRINDTNNKISGSINTAINQANQTTNQLAQKVDNKVQDNRNGSINVNNNTYNVNRPLDPCDLNNVTTPGTYVATGLLNQYKNIPNGIWSVVGFTLVVYGNGNDVGQEIVIPSSTPLTRNRGWGTWYGWNQMATSDDLARLSKNSWRELKVEGSEGGYGTVLCKIDWNNKKATLVGGFYIPPKSGGIIAGNSIKIYANDDFSFLSNPGVEVGNGSIYSRGTPDGNMVYTGDGRWFAWCKFSGSYSGSGIGLGYANIQPK